MKKINNPFTHIPGYNCFGCSPDNQLGLQMHFFEEGEWIISPWKPRPHLTGYGNILHGGIQTTLMDEIASWLLYIKLETAGVTSGINVKFKKAVETDKGIITIRAKLVDHNRKLATIYTELLNTKGELCTEAEIKYFIFSQDVAREKFYYPGKEAFFRNK
ncbi:MAG: hypothetical protein A2X13_08020 [Bacteroidetes bacterium GWC2_33_15]|nr:MAG: hypothetical protein A2X10_05075 [Bacteroidetes bacterium GWA2_33_15]OFX52690.1 MAG: hypothetical protein A2X13_08020 [Bacteroidetes bacterium GWC2_33_15]OFX64004.1 MAG: hypothetical protein A2X15_02315 [Bacteroidetes bacterium GWB2_32_14]OFX67311.1 MAG: hypothetical protein A2X14_12100 [Bacteroidetes bacterium GWD2_33_33]HAN18823.1 thioesterase [Bacteroidales bacterium]